jgi:hypothetical protein
MAQYGAIWRLMASPAGDTWGYLHRQKRGSTMPTTPTHKYAFIVIYREQRYRRDLTSQALSGERGWRCNVVC